MKRGRGTGGGLPGPSSQWKSGEGHGERIVLFADVPEGIPCWVGSSSQAQFQQGSSLRSARFPDCCLWRGALSFPTSERLFGNSWQKTHQCSSSLPGDGSV